MHKTVGIVVLLLLVVAGVSFWYLLRDHTDEPQDAAGLAAAQAAFQRGDFQTALQVTQSLLAANPDDVAVLMLAAESATKIEHWDDALGLYAQVNGSGSEAATARWAEAEIHFFREDFDRAFRSLSLSLEADWENYAAHQRFVDLCSTVGLRRTCIPNILKLISAGQLRPEYLMLLGNADKQTWDPSRLSDLRQRKPNDVLLRLGIARSRFSEGRVSEAIELFEEVVERFPTLVEAHQELGLALLANSSPQMVSWSETLPANANQQAGIWYVYGQWSIRLDNHELERTCYEQAIARDSTYVRAYQSLIPLLSPETDGELLGVCSSRIDQLQKLHTTLERIFQSQGDLTLMKEAAGLCRSLGRMWECVGWASLARSMNPQLEWPSEVVDDVTSRYVINQSTPQVYSDFELATTFEWPSMGAAELNDIQQQLVLDGARVETEVRSDQDVLAPVQLKDVALAVGLDFTFDSNKQDPHEGRRMHEFTGGGVGVLDIDQDGYPDVFFTQGGPFPTREGVTDHQDRCFLNVGVQKSRRFVDVTDSSRLRDRAFGQGVAIGDVDQDGLDDVLVCNIGNNQLWLNAGDGTFVDGSSFVIPEAVWTASAAIADLNLDGIPEIYEANYVQGDDVHTKMCIIGGKQRSCSPLEFSPAADRVLSYNPTVQTYESAIEKSAMVGNSLGVVVFRKPLSDFPSVFVAVDQEANLLGELSIDAPGSRDFSMTDSSLLSGLAYDDAGRAQACMGVAAGDANSDGLLDLFVSNFYLEYYTLYLQNETGVFTDRSRESDTVAETTPMLGFGAQFADLQLDGYADLFVLNGHIDDQTHVGVPEGMVPQVFLGDGSGKFQVSNSAAGYISEPRLGRALVKVDYNRDGRTDFVCGNLETPSGLLENQSPRQGAYLSLQLVGTESARNAICAEVKLILNDSKGDEVFSQTQQLTAGSGYQASNERSLHFSVPDRFAAEMASIMVHWPLGRVERFQDVKLNERYIIVEGQQMVRQ